MKNVKFLAAGAALCALAMTGCTNETDEAGVQDDEQVLMTMQADTSAPQTRADYTQDEIDRAKMNFSWRAKDALSVVVDGVIGNENCQLSTTETGKSVTFSGKIVKFSDTKTIYAIYPYSATRHVVTGGDNKETATTTLTLPNPQLYTIGGAISNSFMVGADTATVSGTDINASVGLKQVMSIIKLNITGAPAKVTGVKLRCADAIFATTATVKLSDATITNPGTLDKVLSMSVTDNSTNHADPKEISFAVFPKAKMDGKKIQIEVTYEGGKWNRIEKDDIAFERNMHYVVAFDGTLTLNDYVEVGNLKVAIGYLVADGNNGAKIGAATDGGLYFKFGSLIGWAGGASGDGTGMPGSNLPGYLFNSKGTVVPSGKNSPTTWDDKDRWIGTTGNVPAEHDPCTYYLGSDWRLPTKDECDKLFKNNIFSPGNPWVWMSPYITNSALGLKFIASGMRFTNEGTLGNVGTNGYFWSGSASKSNYGEYMNFNNNGFHPDSLSWAYAMPVRCVQSVSN